MTESRGAAAKQQVVRVGIALAAAAVLFFVGWMVGRAPLGELERARAIAETRSAVLAADAAIYRAAVALEARNFGTANEHVRAAFARLSTLPSEDDLPGFGAEPAAVVREVRAALDTTDLNVAVDVESQRATVLQLAERLDQAVAATP